MTQSGNSEALRSSAIAPAPIRWPEGYTSAGCLTFDLDAEAAVLTADISAVSRMSPMSHQSYGPLVAVPRILGCLLYTSPSPRDRQKSRMPSSA